jgi:hypothetical protein
LEEAAKTREDGGWEKTQDSELTTKNMKVLPVIVLLLKL